jgi:putative transposase
VKFINEHTGQRVGPDGLRWGVESICAVLCEHGAPIAPSTYYEARARVRGVHDERDKHLTEHITRVHRDNYGVYRAPQGVACAQPREHPGGPPHGRAADA